ncbi:MAG TPA: hypothetical protein VGB74_12670 [Actinoplanes sp.]
MDPLTDARDLVVACVPEATSRSSDRVRGPASARAALAFAGRWVSAGKWLLRELRDLDPDFAARWLAARDEPAELAAEVLRAGGGPLFDGYRA